ncbi:LexA family transcriptional regulator [Campylobacter subantarcticus]|uniref:Peptidase S24 LexA-like protein n=1 Tax=Campylobacter subantarcticus LMG 24374 TaxID=1388751 RepID=A0A0A8H9Y7_9BACT|nr:S24 family peptidase [Campylobacter subantarcticus]AJC90886.1 peptidase S24 LexA-like protein [Campylobacter subantarcticus LMG 24374]EAJ1260367.1 S24 family peptidase [Campylobacter lari]
MEEKEQLLQEMIDFYNVKDKFELAEYLGLSRESAHNWPSRISGKQILIYEKDKKIKNSSKNTENKTKNEDIVLIPFYKDNSVSAGFGSKNYEGSIQYIPFNKQDLRLMFNIQGFLKIGIIPVIGDSMTPTIKEGEMIVFQDDGSMIEGGIYVIEYQSEVFVKRLRKRPLSLISDNKDYPPIIVEENEEIKIIGRVVGTYDLSYRRL